MRGRKTEDDTVNKKIIYSLKNVSKIVDDGGKDKKILNNISFDIYKGDFFGIIGESGAGKSTLLNILGGIDNVSQGKILFGGEEISLKKSRDLALFRRKLGFVFQSFQLINHLSVFDNVAAPLLITKTPKEDIHKKVIQALLSVNFIRPRRVYLAHCKCKELLEKYPHAERILGTRIGNKGGKIFIDTDKISEELKEGKELFEEILKHSKPEVTNLTEVAEGRIRQLPKTLSGGEKQRVAIARAIVNNPKVILADEPTGSLDSQNENIILELLQKIHSTSKITVILVSYSSEVIQQCSRVIKLADGKKVESETMLTEQKQKSANSAAKTREET